MIRNARIRIVLNRRDTDPPSGEIGVTAGTYPIINAALSDWNYIRIIVTSPLGEEFDLNQVRGLKIEMNDHNALEPVEATLRVMIDELDIECAAKIEALPVPSVRSI